MEVLRLCSNHTGQWNMALIDQLCIWNNLEGSRFHESQDLSNRFSLASYAASIVFTLANSWSQNCLRHPEVLWLTQFSRSLGFVCLCDEFTIKSCSMTCGSHRKFLSAKPIALFSTTKSSWSLALWNTPSGLKMFSFLVLHKISGLDCGFLAQDASKP